MIQRIVKLTFQPEDTAEFEEIFEQTKRRIRASEGCLRLELLRATADPNIYFTYSYWRSEADLNAYRKSELFGRTWKRTKALFAAKPEAWSTESLETLE